MPHTSLSAARARATGLATWPVGPVIKILAPRIMLASLRMGTEKTLLVDAPARAHNPLELFLVHPDDYGITRSHHRSRRRLDAHRGPVPRHNYRAVPGICRG